MITKKKNKKITGYVYVDGKKAGVINDKGIIKLKKPIVMNTSTPITFCKFDTDNK